MEGRGGKGGREGEREIRRVKRDRDQEGEFRKGRLRRRV